MLCIRIIGYVCLLAVGVLSQHQQLRHRRDATDQHADGAVDNVDGDAIGIIDRQKHHHQQRELDARAAEPQRNHTEFLQIRDVLNVFSVEHIGHLWPEMSAQLSGQCARDLLVYMQALEEGSMWAMQSECQCQRRIGYRMCSDRTHLLGNAVLCKYCAVP